MTRVIEPDLVQTLAGVKLAMAMWAESPTYASMTMDVDKVIEFAYHCLHDPNTFLRVAVDQDEAVIGFIIGSIAPHGFHDSSFAYDRMVYVTPTARGGRTLVAMIEAFEQWAKEQGASRVMLGVTTGIYTDMVIRVYNRLGYNTVGALTQKEIA